MPKLRVFLALLAMTTSTLLLFAPSVLASESRQSDEQNCLPNYDPCVEPAVDVDCADSGDNGPVFVEGPLTVWGFDVYGLDGDEDGIACEPPPPPTTAQDPDPVVIVIQLGAPATAVRATPRFTG